VLFSSGVGVRVRVMVRFSVWLVSGYAQFCVGLSIFICPETTQTIQAITYSGQNSETTTVLNTAYIRKNDNKKTNSLLTG